MAWGSFWARDRTPVTSVTRATVMTTPDPFLAEPPGNFQKLTSCHWLLLESFSGGQCRLRPQTFHMATLHCRISGQQFTHTKDSISSFECEGWNFCCGAMGSAASWEPWDAGSIPSLAQWVKDPAVAYAATVAPSHGNRGGPKKKKKERKWGVWESWRVDFSWLFYHSHSVNQNSLFNILPLRGAGTIPTVLLNFTK